ESASYRVLYPLLSFLYPAISGRYVNLLPIKAFENIAGSIFIFTPGIMMFFVSLFNSIRKRKYSHLVPIAFFAFALFTPFFYHALHVFTVPYSRWQIIVVISMLAYCALNFDERKDLPLAFPAASFAITLTLMLISYKLSYEIADEFLQVDYVVEEYGVYLYQIVACVVTGVILFFNWKKEQLNKILMGVVAVEAIVMGNMVMGFHGVISYANSLNGGYNNVVTETEIIRQINQNDDSFFRLQSTRAYSSNDNLAAVENFNGTATFHSLYNYDAIDFVRMSHLFKGDTGWSGGAQEKRYNLDAFLGVKYYLFKEQETLIGGTVWPMNIPLGYTRIDDADDGDGYRVYENENFIPMGFTFDTLYYKRSCNDGKYNAFHTSNNHPFDIIRNEEAYLKGAILNDEDLLEVVADNPHLNDEEAPLRETPMIPTDKTLYDCDFYFDPANPDQYIEENVETFSFAEAETRVKADKTELVVTPRFGSHITTEPAYIIVKYPLKTPDYDYRARIHLIGDDNKIIATDYHNNNTGNNNQRFYRGFYADEPVKKIIIVTSGDGIVYGGTDVYVETYGHITNKLNALKDYPLTDIEYDTNYFSFKTDFSESRFVVTQVTYGDGWKIKAIDVNGQESEIQTYNAQGGFVGFVSKAGATRYEMTYYTPYFATGIIISFTGFLIFGGAIGLGAYLDLKKKTLVVEEKQ
ncbi:MAG: YfhO family protein, partial [Bacilli bacterium]